MTARSRRWCGQGLSQRSVCRSPAARSSRADLHPRATTHVAPQVAGKSAEVQQAYCRNKRNTRGARGRRLQRLRSERVERVFDHLLDTGGGRRTWLCGLDKVCKRYLMAATAFNLGRVMRSLFGAGKPRHMAVLTEWIRFLQILVGRLMAAWRSAHQVVAVMRRNKSTTSVVVAV